MLLWTMFHHYASAGDPTHATTIGYAAAATTPCFTLCVATHTHCDLLVVLLRSLNKFQKFVREAALTKTAPRGSGARPLLSGQVGIEVRVYCSVNEALQG